MSDIVDRGSLRPDTGQPGEPPAVSPCELASALTTEAGTDPR
jgi:hypothetical protein